MIGRDAEMMDMAGEREESLAGRGKRADGGVAAGNVGGEAEVGAGTEAARTVAGRDGGVE